MTSIENRSPIEICVKKRLEITPPVLANCLRVTFVQEDSVAVHHRRRIKKAAAIPMFELMPTRLTNELHTTQVVSMMAYRKATA